LFYHYVQEQEQKLRSFVTLQMYKNIIIQPFFEKNLQQARNFPTAELKASGQRLASHDSATRQAIRHICRSDIHKKTETRQGTSLQLSDGNCKFPSHGFRMAYSEEREINFAFPHI